MFNKLRNEMLLFNMISTSLVIVIAFSVIYFVTYSNMERENQRQLQLMSAMPLVPDRPIPGGNSDRPPVLQREPFGPDYRVSFVLFVRNGNLEHVDSYLDFDDRVYEEALEEIGEKAAGKITLDGRKWAFQTSAAPISETRRIVFLDITHGTETLTALLVTLFCTGLAVLLVLLWFSYRFAVRAVRPIEESYNKQRQFVADASHEFKTPLSVINASIAAIEASANESVESQREWFGYIRAEIKRATTLVDNLLYLARADAVMRDRDIPFDLSRACETACAAMEAILYDGEIALETKIAQDIIVKADGERITQVLYILLDNASKYTPRHGRIVFSLDWEQERAVVRVSNTGKGIAPEDLPRIFDRFYRPDASRSQETGGYGLGLPIAKAIVERSGGEISVEANAEMTTFTVRL